jgi:peroxiredoxin
MGMSRRTYLTALVCLLGTATFAQSSVDSVRRISENYHNLRSFEITGHLTVTIPGTKLQLRVDTIDAEAGHSFVPEHSVVFKYGETLSFHGVKLTDTTGRPASPDLLKAGVAMPTHWGHYEEIAANVQSVNELLPESLNLGGVTVECQVLEIVYGRGRGKPGERTVKYWIDADRLLVMKQEFTELQGRHDPAPWRWVYTVDSVKLNQPPPQWLVESANRSDQPEPRPEWLGREAPDFTLRDLDGRRIQLSTMRGKIVLLDFWATWCGPCRAEMPIVKKITDDYSARGLEAWGISDEKVTVVKEWLAHNPWNLPVLSDAENRVSEQFQVQGIPALLIIGRDGKILSYYTGTQSEQSLRSVIDLALKESPSTN